MLWKLINKGLLQFPNAMISDETHSMTYKEVKIETDKICKLLLDAQSGDVYAILCKSEFNSAIALLSMFKAKIPVVLLSLRYGEAHCRKILDVVKPSCIIVDSLNITLLSDYTVDIFDITIGKYQKRFIKKKHKIPKGVATIMFTSGTTGTPKGAMITNDNLICNLLDIELYFEIKKTDRILIARPLYHAAVMTGEFLISILKGLDIIFYNGEFNPPKLIEIVRECNATVLCATPTLFYHISRVAKRLVDPLQLRIIAISGECMTTTVAKLVREAFPNTKIYNVYGLTEASPRVSYLHPDLFDEHPLSVGCPLQSISALIVDDNGNQLPKNIDGELTIKASSVMKGYFQNKAATQKTIINEWLHTGDIAYMDENNLIHIRARKDSMLIRAGMNIYPQEIENALKTDPRIQETLAFGVLDEKVGQRIILKIVINDTNVTKYEIMQACRQKLPIYQIPDDIEIVASLAKNGSGKLVRPRC